MAEAVEFREACYADESSVLAIHDNVYDGRDYLADYFRLFVASPNITPYVACLKEGTIVGFLAAMVVDDSSALVTRGGRVNPNYAGQGIYRRLSEHVYKMTKVKTGVRHVLRTITDANVTASSPSFLSTHKMLQENPLLRFKLDPAGLSLPQGEQISTRMKTVSQTELETIFRDPIIREFLFPDNRLIVDWVPYRPTFSNIPLILETGHRLKVYSDVTRGENGCSGTDLELVKYPAQTQRKRSVRYTGAFV